MYEHKNKYYPYVATLIALSVTLDYLWFVLTTPL